MHYMHIMTDGNGVCVGGGTRRREEGLGLGRVSFALPHGELQPRGISGMSKGDERELFDRDTVTSPPGGGVQDSERYHMKR